MRELDVKWTEGQRKAIRSRGKTLLISAAAGSGKTAVLTERIIDRLLAEEEQLEITKLLVVTFTRAASTELRNRIREALEKEVARDPSNARLTEQLLSVGRAKISTIDSFYLDLIRSHAEELHISPRVRVEDGAQIALLEKTVMNSVIDDYYNGDTESAYAIDDFASFCTLFSSAKKESGVIDVLLKLFRTLMGYIDGIDVLKHTARRLSQTADAQITGDNLLFAPLFEKCQALCDGYLPRFGDILSYLAANEVQNEKVGPTYSAIYMWLSELQTMLSAHADYGALYAHFHSYSVPKLGVLRGDKATKETEAAKGVRDAFGDMRKRLMETFFLLEEKDVRAMTLAQAEILWKLYRLLFVYQTRLWTEKMRRNIVDFPDMARLVLGLLYDAETGMEKESVKEIRLRYSEIYIDEYQDTSDVQDLIFRLIAREDNRFMVGDAKQSIYGFRGAVPDGFLRYRKQFDEDPASGETIFLSDNFRCNAQVISLSNVVFSLLFGVGGGVPYEADDALVFSKKSEHAPKQTKVPIVLFSNDKLTEDTDGEAEEDTEETEQSEATWIADKITDLLANGRLDDGSRIRMRDIAVLLRSVKTGAAPIAEALEERGIATYNTANKAFFENAEVSLVYSLLSVIDNPQKDVHLAAVLKSPLYGVTLDELIFIRKSHPGGSLYDALCAFTEKTGYTRGTYFLSRIDHYRRVSRGMPVDRFLWYLYGDTGILSTVYQKEQTESTLRSTDPLRMRANLMMFYEYARTFEKGAFGGLYAFVLFIADVIEDKASLPTAQLTGEGSDAVRIMTIHQSKGLEFPVCFVAGLGKKRNENDLKQPILLSRKLGVATHVRLSDNLINYEHPYQGCVKEEIKRAQAEEEWRTLYVALTRAREQLYLTATVKDATKAIEKARDAANLPSRESVLALSTYISCILTAVMAQETSFSGFEILTPDRAESPIPCASHEDEAPTEGTTEAKADGMTLAEAKRFVGQRLSYVYPEEARTRLPMKLGVSALLRMRDAALAEARATGAISGGEPIEITPKELQTEYAIPTEAPPIWDIESSGFDAGSEEYMPFYNVEDIPLPDETEAQPLIDAPSEEPPVDREEATVTKPARMYAKPRFMEETERTASAAERGTATHTFMQFCDLVRLAEYGVDAEISRLLERGFITEATAHAIDRRTLFAFTKSTLFARLQKAREIRREMRFNLFVPASAYTDVSVKLPQSTATEEKDAKILLQGVIDCYFTDENGRLVLLDYKTDHFPHALCNTEGAVEAILTERYRDQLTLYCTACKELTLRTPDEIRIYSFALGRDFELGEIT